MDEISLLDPSNSCLIALQKDLDFEQWYWYLINLGEEATFEQWISFWISTFGRSVSFESVVIAGSPSERLLPLMAWRLFIDNVEFLGTNLIREVTF